jgi:hypothetical protein
MHDTKTTQKQNDRNYVPISIHRLKQGSQAWPESHTGIVLRACGLKMHKEGTLQN